MSDYFKFYLLWMFTGSPVTALVIVLALAFAADWYSVGYLRRLYKVVVNFRLGSRLMQELALNPANKKARFDLAGILLGQRRFAKAIEVLKPVLEDQPDDLGTLYLMGQACLGAGKHEQGELFLSTVEQAEPGFRHGEAPLEIGKARLGRGDAQGALEPLRRFSTGHPNSVEGHFQLSRALAATGDAAGARVERERTWHEYTTSLRYQRRLDRIWAWRARPSRPLMWAALLLAGMVVSGYVLQHADLGRSQRPDPGQYEEP